MRELLKVFPWPHIRHQTAAVENEIFRQKARLSAQLSLACLRLIINFSRLYKELTCCPSYLRTAETPTRQCVMIQVKECIQILSSLAVYNPLVSCSQNVLQYSCRRSCINNRVFLYTLEGALRSLHREQSVNCCETETRWSEWPVMVVVGVR